MTTTQNAPATVQSTVEEGLRTAGYSTYLRQAQPVVDALVAREQAICESLLDFAETNGASTDEVTEFLTGLGLSLKPEEPETAAEAPAQEGDALARIEASLSTLTATVTSLTDFARRNGYRA